MADPITTGALVAAVLSAAAGALGKETVTLAVRDGYGALKSAVARWAGSDVDKLEENPDSAPRAGVIAETVDALPAEAQSQIQALAMALRGAMDEAGMGGAVDNRVTVIADRGSVAAGRDVNIAIPPKAGG